MSSGRACRRLSVATVCLDLVCFATFGLVGLHSHAEALTVANFGRAFVPFAAAWFLVAFPFGQLAKPGAADARETLGQAAAAWTAAWILGFVARMVVFGRPFVFAFALVSFLLLGSLLVSWRITLALVLERKRARLASKAAA